MTANNEEEDLVSKEEEELKNNVERDKVSLDEELMENYLEKISSINSSLSEYKKKEMEKIIDSSQVEYDNEDDIAKGLLNDLKDTIKRDLISKEKARKTLTYFLIWSFTIIGCLTFLLVGFSERYDTKVVLAVVTGFFINTISLVLVLLKYMFSPSKEIYDYTLGIFKRKKEE